MTIEELKPIWIEALRSGNYKQGSGGLYFRTASGDAYCCLGVAGDLCGIPKDELYKGGGIR